MGELTKNPNKEALLSQALQDQAKHVAVNKYSRVNFLTKHRIRDRLTETLL